MNFVANFNVPDQPTLGPDWTNLSGTWEIFSLTARCSSASPSQHVAVHDSASSDVLVEGTLHTRPANGNGGMVIRASDDNNYFVLVFSISGNGFFYRRQGGGFTELATGGNFNSGDVAALEGIGTTLRVLKNSVEVFSVTSAFNQTATKHGLRENSTNRTRWSAFAVTDHVSGRLLLRLQSEGLFVGSRV